LSPEAISPITTLIAVPEMRIATPAVTAVPMPAAIVGTPIAAHTATAVAVSTATPTGVSVATSAAASEATPIEPPAESSAASAVVSMTGGIPRVGRLLLHGRLHGLLLSTSAASASSAASAASAATAGSSASSAVSAASVASASAASAVTAASSASSAASAASVDSASAASVASASIAAGQSGDEGDHLGACDSARRGEENAYAVVLMATTREPGGVGAVVERVMPAARHATGAVELSALRVAAQLLARLHRDELSVPVGLVVESDPLGHELPLFKLLFAHGVLTLLASLHAQRQHRFGAAIAC
jgi:hypothetical protein